MTGRLRLEEPVTEIREDYVGSSRASGSRQYAAVIKKSTWREPGHTGSGAKARRTAQPGTDKANTRKSARKGMMKETLESRRLHVGHPSHGHRSFFAKPHPSRRADFLPVCRAWLRKRS